MVVLGTVTAGEADSELYRRTIVAVIRTVALLTVFLVFCAGSWLV